MSAAEAVARWIERYAVGPDGRPFKLTWLQRLALRAHFGRPKPPPPPVVIEWGDCYVGREGERFSTIEDYFDHVYGPTA